MDAAAIIVKKYDGEAEELPVLVDNKAGRSAQG